MFSQKTLSVVNSIDFSRTGYQGGDRLPFVPAVIQVRPQGGDDTRLLQAAIDELSKRELQADGFRGALLLGPGIFRVSGQLRLDSSGIVIRGNGEQATTIVASGIDRRGLIRVGANRQIAKGLPIAVEGQVAAGAMHLALKSVDNLKVGDRVVISRPSTKEWISSLGMDTLKGTFADLRFRWTPGSRDLNWYRTITGITRDNRTITLDAPITSTLDPVFGGASVAKVSDTAFVKNIGIENLVFESDFDRLNSADEEHSWFAVLIDNVQDAWVRDVRARYFVSSLVKVGQTGSRITVERCVSQQPVAEVGGYRRLSFWVEGQQVLVKDCTAEDAVNAFAAGFCSAGPNVFFNCRAINAKGASGSYESWASGVLYENVKIEGAPLIIGYNTARTQAGGWTAANSLLWNCEASGLEALGPQEAANHLMKSRKGLYSRLLQARLGKKAAEEILKSIKPVYTRAEVPVFHRATDASADTALTMQKLDIVNGRFVVGGKAVWGGSVNDAWWLGHSTESNALDAGRSISRYVPGKEGPGMTENLSELAKQVKTQGTPFFQSGPAIWYDRRRDDHTIIKRKNADVWAAFYELPWARSGTGLAWDGLSKYDLTRYNPWYFNRTRDFSKLADQHGIVLYHHLYNNHNLLETASHWADFPWRPANNINTTGLPEPPPLEPRERIHVANQFYDVNNPDLRKLHHAYITHVLDQLGSAENIIFGLSFQYSGPLAFQQFFQRTVAEWERKNGRKVRLVIDTGKDITDSILADPELSKQIAVIDMRYWHYLPDGTLWAPKAGRNLAFREMHPREFGDPTTPQQIYRQVREYRDRFPDKAVVVWHAGAGQVAALMAGTAQVLTQNPTAGHGQGRVLDVTDLDKFVQKYLPDDLMNMLPVDNLFKADETNWCLSDKGRNSILIYSLEGPSISFNMHQGTESYKAIWFNPVTGALLEVAEGISMETSIKKPGLEAWILLLKRF